MRVCVLGAGAIGGLIGTRLAAAGVETSALARGATLAALQAHGWRTESGGELITAPVRAAADAAELGQQDLVVLAVKAQAARSAAAVIGPLLGPQTMVLTAMNGVPWWFFDGFGGPCQGRHLDSVDPGGTIAAAIGSTARDRRGGAHEQQRARTRPGPAPPRGGPDHRGTRSPGLRPGP